MIIAINNILDRPAIERIPSTESIQRIRSTAAICLKGPCRIFMIIPTTNNMSRSQREIDLPLIVKRVISGILIMIWKIVKSSSDHHSLLKLTKYLPIFIIAVLFSSGLVLLAFLKVLPIMLIKPKKSRMATRIPTTIRI